MSTMIYIVLASNARTSHQGAESLIMLTPTLTGNQARHSKSLSQVDGSYVVLPDLDEDASCGFHEQCSFAKPDMAQYYVLFKENVTCPLMILILLDITNSLDIFYCDYATEYMFIYLHCQLPVITFTQKYTQLPKWCNADCNEIVNKTRIYYKK